MKIAIFAEQYRLKTTREDCQDSVRCDVIKGKQGQIFEYGDGVFGAMFMPDEKNAHPGRSWARKWSTVKAACLAAGMTLRQEGDFEGVFLFSPGNKGQAKQAIAAAKVKVRRQLTPEQAAAGAARLAVARVNRKAPEAHVIEG